MAKYVVLHDRRLRGGIPARPGVAVLKTDGSVSLCQTFRAIRACAAYGRIHTLFVVCHGYAGVDKHLSMSVDGGGKGLLLGSEEVLHHNVSLWRAIRGAVENIVIMACAAADTRAGNEGTEYDGRYLMLALALHTGATVYAAERIQTYYTFRNLPRGLIDFIEWEGDLYRFLPNGLSWSKVAHAPKELRDVIGKVTSR